MTTLSQAQPWYSIVEKYHTGKQVAEVLVNGALRKSEQCVFYHEHGSTRVWVERIQENGIDIDHATDGQRVGVQLRDAPRGQRGNRIRASKTDFVIPQGGIGDLIELLFQPENTPVRQRAAQSLGRVAATEPSDAAKAATEALIAVAERFEESSDTAKKSPEPDRDQERSFLGTLQDIVVESLSQIASRHPMLAARVLEAARMTTDTVAKKALLRAVIISSRHCAETLVPLIKTSSVSASAIESERTASLKTLRRDLRFWHLRSKRELLNGPAQKLSAMEMLAKSLPAETEDRATEIRRLLVELQRQSEEGPTVTAVRRVSAPELRNLVEAMIAPRATYAYPAALGPIEIEIKFPCVASEDQFLQRITEDWGAIFVPLNAIRLTDTERAPYQLFVCQHPSGLVKGIEVDWDSSRLGLHIIDPISVLDPDGDSDLLPGAPLSTRLIICGIPDNA